MECAAIFAGRPNGEHEHEYEYEHEHEYEYEYECGHAWPSESWSGCRFVIQDRNESSCADR